ncbi:hypothetical protein FACS189428_3620 [Clostridia bacterium]|nr:hypothetical protein FACS189428_3620 [Clostridia bacterium]
MLVQQLHLQIQVLVDEVVDEEVQDFLADEALLEAEVVEDEGGVGKQHTL